jgi:hypothetical protein
VLSRLGARKERQADLVASAVIRPPTPPGRPTRGSIRLKGLDCILIGFNEIDFARFAEAQKVFADTSQSGAIA